MIIEYRTAIFKVLGEMMQYIYNSEFQSIHIHTIYIYIIEL
jgi:hypothetical protein